MVATSESRSDIEEESKSRLSKETDQELRGETCQPCADPTKEKHHDHDTKVSMMKASAWVCVVTSILVVLFIFAMDTTVVADVQPDLLNTFGEVQKLPWISVSYAAGGIGTNLLWGKLYGLFDNKITYLVAFIIFELGSAVCGAAQDMNMLIVSRTICGVGGMGVYLGSINILSRLTSQQDRSKYIGYIGVTFGLGTALGPVIGGALADSSATWRWAFYLNLCIGGVAAPVYLFLIPSIRPVAHLTFWTRVAAIDWIGAILIAGATTSLLMAISFGGSMYEWQSGQIIGLFICSGFLWAAFPLQQLLLTEPTRWLFPFDFLRSFQMDILFATTVAGQVNGFVCVYFIPLYFQFIRGDDALQAGVRLLPFVFLRFIAVIINGVLMPKAGWYMIWFVAGSSIAVVGTSLLSTISATTGVGAIYGFSVLAAFGSGMFAQAGFSISQIKSKPSRVADAVCFLGAAQMLGMALAFSMSNSIFVNEATRRISSVLAGRSRTAVQNAITGVDGALFDTLETVVKGRVLSDVVESIRRALILPIVAMSGSLVLSMFMKRERLLPRSDSAQSDGPEDLGSADESTLKN